MAGSPKRGELSDREFECRYECPGACPRPSLSEGPEKDDGSRDLSHPSFPLLRSMVAVRGFQFLADDASFSLWVRSETLASPD